MTPKIPGIRTFQRGLRFGFLLTGTVLILTACLNDPQKDLSQNQIPGSFFSTSTVDAEYIGAYPSAAMSPVDGSFHASYYSKFDWGTPGGGALKHARLLFNGTWSIEVVDGKIYDAPDEDVGQFTNIGVDASGGIHIAYWDITNADLKYATLASGMGQSWVIETVDNLTAVCEDTDLKINSDIVYIGYCDGSQILLASKNITDTGLWPDPEVVATIGADTRAKVSMQFDSNNDLHAVFFDAFEKKIKYTVRTFGVWSNPADVTPTPLVLNETRMVFLLDASDLPQVIYYDIDGKELLHAYQNGSNWSRDLVADVGDIIYNASDPIASSVGYISPSGLVDQQGRLHVSYFVGQLSSGSFGVGNQDLKHAWKMPDAIVWAYETLDGTGDVGRTSAMAEESDGTIHVIYRDSENNDLKYLYIQQ